VDNAVWGQIVQSGAAVVVVALFLFHEAKRSTRADELAKGMREFMEDTLKRVESIKQEFLNHNQRLAEEFGKTTRILHDDMKMLANSHLELTKETVQALVETKHATAELRDELARLREQVQNKTIVIEDEKVTHVVEEGRPALGPKRLPRKHGDH
jgi:uncharacterized membrane-anchored protein YjiN (DUF445 family)